MKKNSGGFAPIMMIILLLVLVGGVVYYASLQKPKLLPIANTPTPAEAIRTALVPTSNWKTYTNESGFSIKYPASLFIAQDSQYGTPEAGPKTVGGFIYDPKGQKPPGENYYINFNIGDSDPIYTTELKSSELVILDGQTIKKITLNTISSTIYSIKLSEGKFVQFYVSGDSSRKEVSDQILSTFKFTN